jgi:hypothetical protein
MADTLTPLIADLLEWLARGPRTYDDVMDAWRTSCPRLTVWEDAVDSGLVTRLHANGQPTQIALTEQGRQYLAAQGRYPAAMSATLAAKGAAR